MPKIREDVVRAVTDAAKIEDVVGDFIKLRKAGVNMTGLCPFHDDKNDGNFIVRPSTIPDERHGNTFHCFVCGKGGGCVQFLMEAERMTFPDAIRWLGRKYCIEVDDVPLNWTPPPPRPTPPPLPPLVMERTLVKQTMTMATEKNLFCYWLSQLPWTNEQRARLPHILWEYCVGGWTDGRVVFWGIDHDGIPRAAKLMKYMPDGHRDKERNPGWLYNQDGVRQTCDPDNHTILKPMFGSHLLRRHPNAIVNIVESEKTALIMATFYGNIDDQLWLACGGLQFLRLESMQPLIDQQRTVWLWPDKDGIDKWQELKDRLGYDGMNVYTRFHETCWRMEDGPKADCADIIIRMMRHPEQKPVEPKAKQDNFTWNTDEPFLDPTEMRDPRLHAMRMRCAIHGSRWGQVPRHGEGDGQIDERIKPLL